MADAAQTLLARGVMSRQAGAVAAALAAGANPDTPVRPGGPPPLLLAVVHRAAPVVQALLAGGADVNVTSPAAATCPLLEAIKQWDVGVTLALVDAGAAPTLPLHAGLRPIDALWPPSLQSAAAWAEPLEVLRSRPPVVPPAPVPPELAAYVPTAATAATGELAYRLLRDQLVAAGGLRHRFDVRSGFAGTWVRQRALPTPPACAGRGPPRSRPPVARHNQRWLVRGGQGSRGMGGGGG
jgi:hypothetical protein